jgi:hypothetical protein
VPNIGTLITLPISSNLDTNPDCVNVSLTGGGKFLPRILSLNCCVDNTLPYIIISYYINITSIKFRRIK